MDTNRQKRGMARIITAMLIVTVICLCGCSGQNTAAGEEVSSSDLPEKHFIPYDETMGSLYDDQGADSVAEQFDDPDSKYYVINDYYNMKSGGRLHIIPEFEAYQQTTEYSCVPASTAAIPFDAMIRASVVSMDSPYAAGSSGSGSTTKTNSVSPVRFTV